MEQYLKDLLKKIKLNEPTISTILGALVIIIVAFLIFKYYRSEKQTTLPPTSEELESLEWETGTSGIPQNLPETYKVAQGDTLWLISEKFYQSGYNWLDIAQSNNLSNPDYLTIGQEIILPKVAMKQPEIAVASTEMVGQTATETGGLQVSQTGQSITTGNYVVQQGDHLWQIAVRAYGDGYKWPEIAKINNLINPDFLEVGQELKLPR